MAVSRMNVVVHAGETGESECEVFVAVVQCVDPWDSALRALPKASRVSQKWFGGQSQVGRLVTGRSCLNSTHLRVMVQLTTFEARLFLGLTIASLILGFGILYPRRILIRLLSDSLGILASSFREYCNIPTMPQCDNATIRQYG